MHPPPENNAWLEPALAALPAARVAIFGDFCVDAYWDLAPDDPPPLSIETGLPVRRVLRQRYALGGAGNVLANLIDLGVRDVRPIGFAGRDPWGAELLRLLHLRVPDLSSILIGPDWQTMVYAKPLSGGIEQNRFDFGAFNPLPDDASASILNSLSRAASECRVVVINQQIPSDLSQPAFIDRINRIIADHPATRFIVDARDAAPLFRGAILKLNAHEAAALLNEPRPRDSIIPDEHIRTCARKIHQHTGQPVFITRSERGMTVAADNAITEIPAIPTPSPIDPVGAGDTVVAALAAVIASGGDMISAARLANLAASVTVRKIGMTGTATPDEIRALTLPPHPIP